MLQAGIVGLPNVGKSTLFNALTRSRKAEAANYPFCTIDPNVGMVKVPDPRLEVLQKIARTQKVIPATIEFVDIAGLVKGASKGAGRGNQFLDHIRKVDAIVQVVRCFTDETIVHEMGTIDPLRDIEVISMELIYADMKSIETHLIRAKKNARSGDKEATLQVDLLERLLVHMDAGNPACTLKISEGEQALLKSYCLMSEKPILYACNVSDKDLEHPEANIYVEQVRTYVQQHHNAGIVIVCASLEAELSELPPEEAQVFFDDLGIKDSGVSELIRSTYQLLGLASYFTAGEKEVRAWTFKFGMKAPECAGVIHTDFIKGFIKAEIVSYQDLAHYGSIDAARKAGRYRLEGKDYVFQEGDVVLFRCNT